MVKEIKHEYMMIVFEVIMFILGIMLTVLLTLSSVVGILSGKIECLIVVLFIYFGIDVVRDTFRWIYLRFMKIKYLKFKQEISNGKSVDEQQRE